MSTLGSDEAETEGEQCSDSEEVLSIEEQLARLRSEREEMRTELGDDS